MNILQWHAQSSDCFGHKYVQKSEYLKNEIIDDCNDNDVKDDL